MLNVNKSLMLNPNSNPTDSKNGQQDDKLPEITTEGSGSFNLKKNINALGKSSKHIPLPLDQAAGGASEVSLMDRLMGDKPPSYEETINADTKIKLVITTNTSQFSPAKEGDLQKPAGRKLKMDCSSFLVKNEAGLHDISSLSKCKENTTKDNSSEKQSKLYDSHREASALQKPLTDKMWNFIINRTSFPSNDLVFKTLSEKMEGFDKLDEQDQNELVQQAMEKFSSRVVLKLPK